MKNKRNKEMLIYYLAYIKRLASEVFDNNKAVIIAYIVGFNLYKYLLYIDV